jgi:hypothetical protein
MPKNSEKDLPLLPTQFLNLTTVLEAIADQHELLGRLRDKQPLVVVSPSMPPVMVANGPAQAAPVAVAPAAVQVVATATVEALQTSAPTPLVVEEPAEPAVQESYMGLGFLSNSLFG